MYEAQSSGLHDENALLLKVSAQIAHGYWHGRDFLGYSLRTSQNQEALGHFSSLGTDPLGVNHEEFPLPHLLVRPLEGGQANKGGDAEYVSKEAFHIRFTGEWFIYYVLIALGGGVLLGLTSAVLEPAGEDVIEQVFTWVIPSGAAGAVIVAAWLVEAKQSIVENMAPVLTMVFTPLFAVMLVASAVIYAVSGLGGEFNREQLGVFDILLMVVLALVLYGLSARESTQQAGLMDRIQLVAVVGALVLDGMVLGSMVARIGDLGFTPNRVAALGLNLVLFVNLFWAGWLSIRFLAGRSTFHRLERWQTTYLPVFALWAAAIVVILPLLFSFA